jgi:hypothetical protein
MDTIDTKHGIIIGLLAAIIVILLLRKKEGYEIIEDFGKDCLPCGPNQPACPPDFGPCYQSEYGREAKCCRDQ